MDAVKFNDVGDDYIGVGINSPRFGIFVDNIKSLRK